MTLSRQLMYSGIVILFCLFVGMISYVVKNTQNFLNQQLASHSQDAATALGLSLSMTMRENDLVTAGRIVDAIWDRGYYQSIEVDAANGAPILERHLQIKVYKVPQWFIDLLKLKTEKREAIIMDGWKKVGLVKIESNPGFAYQQIWLTFIDSLQWFLFTSIIATIFGAILLYIILRPLRAITEQAIAICNQQFPIQQNLPWTIDLRQVVEAMNNMSRRLKKLFEEQTKVSEELREQVYKDPVTHLGNRRYFDLQFDYLLKDEERGAGGALLFIELKDFKAYNDAHGYEQGDHLLQTVANVVLTQCARFDSAIVAHIKGADFAVILPNKSQETSQELAAAICQQFAELSYKGLSKEKEVGHIGIALFKFGDNKKEIFAQADMALRSAQMQGSNQWKLLQDMQPSFVRGAQEWGNIFSSVLAENKILLHFQEVQLWQDPSGIKSYETYMRIRLSENEVISAAVFMPMAERLNQILALDKLVIENVVEKIHHLDKQYQFFVNLSASLLDSEDFKDWLLEKIKALKGKASYLIIELPEFGVISKLEKAREFFHQLTLLGAKTSIDHYGKNFSTFSYLYNLKVNYLKIDGSFIKEIDTSEENQFFVKSLVDIAHSLDIHVIAESVETAVALAIVKELKVDGAQGYFIHKPESLGI